MDELTEKEIAAFNGLNESYIEMDKQRMANAPKCHFRKMMPVDDCSEMTGHTFYWECSVCGHIKH